MSLSYKKFGAEMSLSYTKFGAGMSLLCCCFLCIIYIPGTTQK